jgi:hypothetical protein
VELLIDGLRRDRRRDLYRGRQEYAARASTWTTRPGSSAIVCAI